MEPRITSITLGVSDLSRAIRFYRDGLGFPTQVAEGASFAFFTTGGTRLALFPLDRLAEYIGLSAPPVSGQFGGITLAHHVRRKEEVSEVLALAHRSGGKILKPARPVFWGGESATFSDPDGYCWEVAWGPMFTFDKTGAMTF